MTEICVSFVTWQISQGITNILNEVIRMDDQRYDGDYGCI